jgi:hypothetical protein
MKPAMRSAGAAQLKKYLLSRLSDKEVQQEEQKFAAQANLPGAK